MQLENINQKILAKGKLKRYWDWVKQYTGYSKITEENSTNNLTLNVRKQINNEMQSK